MKIKVIRPDFEIHTTPLETISMDPYTIDIWLDDINEQRYRITAKPYQAMRVTTIDCLSSQDYDNEFCYRGGRYHRHILLVEDSPLIEELKSGGSDQVADFMSKASHYVLPLQENIIDIIAHNLIISTA